MRHLGTVLLETERLRLRRYRLEDAPDMFANWVTDAEAARFWSWEPHANMAETRALLEKWMALYSVLKYYHWVIADRATDEAVGYIYLDDIDDVDDSASVHYLLSRRLWNGGLMTEACCRVIDFAMHEIGLRILRSHHHAENPASGRVLQKCGFRCVGEEYRQHEKPQLCGKYYLYERK